MVPPPLDALCNATAGGCPQGGLQLSVYYTANPATVVQVPRPGRCLNGAVSAIS